mgnify:CR=1 FL=1
MSKAPNVQPFKVFTFYRPRPGRRPVRSHIAAYTRWASEEWAGCRVYEILAENGAEAKRAAVDARLADELRAARQEPGEGGGEHG